MSGFNIFLPQINVSKPNFPKTAIRRSKPWKRVNFLTVSANCEFKQTSNEKGQPPPCNLLVSMRLGLAYHICESPAGWWCVGRCAHWVSFLVCLLIGVKVAGVVGDGVAVGVRPDAVLVLLPMACSCSDRDGCAHLSGLKRSARVGLCASLTSYTYIYIIGKTNYFNTKTKFSLFLFGSIKISLYLCST